MTTYVLFQPSITAPFQFSPTLDGVQYSAVVTWGLAGQRWYINLYDQTGNRIFTLPVIGSPDAIQTSSLTWDELTGTVTVTTAAAHGLTIGMVVELTITDVVPATYNGIWSLFVTGPMTLTFSQETDPGGDATAQGNIGRDINIAGGYFQISTLVYRQSTGQFEISP